MKKLMLEYSGINRIRAKVKIERPTVPPIAMGILKSSRLYCREIPAE